MVNEHHKTSYTAGFRRKTLFVNSIRLVAIALIIAIGCFGWRYYKNSQNPIPQDIRSSAGFTLYYPLSLPKGWQIDTRSWSRANNVVTYSVINPSNKTYAVSDQPFPEGFDIDQFNSQKIAGPTTVVTDAGKATVGILESRLLASFSGKSWVLISAPQGASNNELQVLVNSLKADR